MATDAVGMQLLLADPGVLECHTHWVSAVRFSEIGASEVVLRAGYNIGSLMLRYQGIDFRDRAKWNCNQRISPLLPDAYDGFNLHPLEVGVSLGRGVDGGWGLALAFWARKAHPLADPTTQLHLAVAYGVLGALEPHCHSCSATWKQVMFVKALHHHVVTEAPWLQPAIKYEQWAAEDRSLGAEDINRNEFRHGRRGRGAAGAAGQRGRCKHSAVPDAPQAHVGDALGQAHRQGACLLGRGAVHLGGARGDGGVSAQQENQQQGPALPVVRHGGQGKRKGLLFALCAGTMRSGRGCTLSCLGSGKAGPTALHARAGSACAKAAVHMNREGTPCIRCETQEL